MTRCTAGQRGPAQEARLADGSRAQTPDLALPLFSSQEGCVMTVTKAESGDMVVDMWPLHQIAML